MMCHKKVKQVERFLFLYFCRKTGLTGPVNIGNSSHPGCPELPVSYRKGSCICCLGYLFMRGAGLKKQDDETEKQWPVLKHGNRLSKTIKIAQRHKSPLYKIAMM